MEPIGILIAVLVGLAMLAVFNGAGALLSGDDDTARLQDLFAEDLGVDTGGGQPVGEGPSKSAIKRFDSKLRARGFGDKLTMKLIQADLKITATEYMLLVLGITLLGALLGYAISRQPISALVAGLISLFMPGFVVSLRTGRRRRNFANQLVDALTQLVGSLRSGYSILQAMDAVASQMPNPAGEEFARVVREVQLGQPMVVALDNLAERIGNEDLVMIIAAINTNRQVGGNLAEILDTVAETIRERVRIKQEIQVLTAQQSISGYVLVFLPIALGAFLLIINPTYQMRLFTPGITLCIPGGAGLGIIVGFIIMRRIVDIDV